MSDTPAEIRDHWTLFRNARGRVLVHGLGLGMAVRGLLLDSEVEHVLVIEKDPDVIAYIAPQLEARFGTARWTVRQDDALTWKPEKGARWDVVWHDIWPSITSDNLDSMATLHRRFGARCDWQGSWAREECKDRARREKKHGGWW
jgi:spermidine synthase